MYSIITKIAFFNVLIGSTTLVFAQNILPKENKIETPINTAPRASDNVLTVNQNTNLVITTADLGYVDDESDEMSNFIIRTLPANGFLYTGGSTLAANDVGVEITFVPFSISKADMDSKGIRFVQTNGGFGDDYADFNFRVNDGELDSEIQYTITINVNATLNNTDQLESELFNVYPNPASGLVTIEGEGLETVTVIDEYGAIVLLSESHSIDVSGLNKGFYFLKIKTIKGVLVKRLSVL